MHAGRQAFLPVAPFRNLFFVDKDFDEDNFGCWGRVDQRVQGKDEKENGNQRSLRIQTDGDRYEKVRDYTNPLRTAQTAACVRSETPTFRRMCCTCSLTVS